MTGISLLSRDNYFAEEKLRQRRIMQHSEDFTASKWKAEIKPREAQLHNEYPQHSVVPPALGADLF